MIKIKGSAEMKNFTFCVFLYSLFFLTSTICLSAVRNYDNHPALAKALEYDSEANGGDLEKANRAEAEKYYLEYLKDVNESFQKARVYSQLGALYAVAINPKLGEKPDYEKARFYFQKVLELEPKRIGSGRTTIRARTMLASMKTHREERIIARIEAYEWLTSLDEQKIRDLWLPITPNNTTPNESQWRKIKNLLPNIRDTIEYNILSGIKMLPIEKKFVYLKEIKKRLPGTNLENFAINYIKQEGIEFEAREPNTPVEAITKGPVIQEMDETVAIWKKASFYIIAFVVAVIICLVFWTIKGKAPEK